MLLEDVKKEKFARYSFMLFDKHFTFMALDRGKITEERMLYLAFMDSRFDHVKLSETKNGMLKFTIVNRQAFGDLEDLHELTSVNFFEKDLESYQCWLDYKEQFFRRDSTSQVLREIHRSVNLFLFLRKVKKKIATKTCHYQGCANPYKSKPPCALCYE